MHTKLESFCYLLFVFLVQDIIVPQYGKYAYLCQALYIYLFCFKPIGALSLFGGCPLFHHVYKAPFVLVPSIAPSYAYCISGGHADDEICNIFMEKLREMRKIKIAQQKKEHGLKVQKRKAKENKKEKKEQKEKK